MGIVFGTLFLVGCSGTTPNLGKIGKSNNCESNQKTKSYEMQNANMKKNQKDDLLWYMDAGLVAYYAQDYNTSTHFFDQAEKKIKAFNKKVWAGTLFSNVGAILTNDTFMDYTPKIYEGIMVNTYKGIGFMSEGDLTNARIEFNRALERQRRAKDFFIKEIEQEQKKIEEDTKARAKDKKINLAQTQKASNDARTKDFIQRRYSNLFAFKPYPDFVNPFTTYMSGLFFLSVHDYAKATDLFKETYGMIQANATGASYVKEDLLYAMKASASLNGVSKKHYAWIVFANGESISKKEMRFDIPLFLVTNKVYYTGIALPTLQENPAVYPYLIVHNGKHFVKTKEIASMDKIIKTEFKKRFPTIMTRAITRAVTQSIIQYQLQKEGGVFGGLLGAVYQGLMNHADTRQWNLLPKDFQIARIELANPHVMIRSPQAKWSINLDINQNKNHIIYISIPHQDGKEIVNEVSF
ncbi:COG3014 family protein [Sulfurospirillum sp. 1612]|uniref:COG3014 family protein n=1 Tax=Sulfurospirillum sp. 1612 TaxID=3094835 RepID=UPI002F925BE9